LKREFRDRVNTWRLLASEVAASSQLLDASSDFFELVDVSMIVAYNPVKRLAKRLDTFYRIN
jgi:hypothetical protein